MVRTPLAHRTDDGILDSVACYLPNFNPQTTHEIVDYLTGNGKEPEAAVAGKNGVLENPQDVSPAVPRGRDDYERQMTEWSKLAHAASPAPLPGLDDLPETEDAPAATREPEPVTASGSEPTTIPEPKPVPKPEPGPVNPLYRPPGHAKTHVEARTVDQTRLVFHADRVGGHQGRLRLHPG